MTLGSPPLPIPAGPYGTIHTFGAHTSTPTTVVSQANLGSTLNAPLSITVSLSADGTPGFPLQPAAGDVYCVHVQMTESGGPHVFCMDLAEPMKFAVPFVRVQNLSNVPLLSGAGLAMLALLLGAAGLFAAKRRGANEFAKRANEFAPTGDCGDSCTAPRSRGR
jgi:hypothetical protein